MNVKKIEREFLSNRCYIDRIVIEEFEIHFPHFTSCGEKIVISPEFFFETMLPKIYSSKIRSFNYQISKLSRCMFVNFEITPISTAEKKIYLPQVCGNSFLEIQKALNTFYKEYAIIISYKDELYSVSNFPSLESEKVAIIDITRLSDTTIAVTIEDIKEENI